MIHKKLTKLNGLSKELERKVVGSIINDFSKDKAIELINSLNQTDFQFFSKPFEIIKESVMSRNTIGSLLTHAEIRVHDFVNIYLTGQDWKRAVDELHRVSMAISYIKKAYGSIESVEYKNIEQNIADHIGGLSELSIFSGNTVGAKDGVREYEKNEKEVRARLATGESYVGMSTGFDNLDFICEGILPRTLTIIGGYSGAGKTSLAINIMANILKAKKRVVMFSLEMGSNEIYMKLIALLAEINQMKMLKGDLTQAEIERIEIAKAQVYEMELTIYDNMRDMQKLRLAMIKESLLRKPALFVIDYLQMISDLRFKTAIERISANVNELKELCRMLDIPVIAISSISNESANAKNSETGGYKGSGDIEFTSDLAIKLINIDDRETRDQKKRERRPVFIDALITKQRFGITGSVQLSFDGYIGKFKDGR